MKISYNWLKDFLSIQQSPEDTAQLLTNCGLEVEGIETIQSVKGGLEGLVVGEVLTKEKHPDADRLSVTTVNIGEEISQIVCGAANVAAGQKVVVAKVGATLYPIGGEPFSIKKAKIRGMESCGMICAEDEIGLGNSHDGIMVLDNAAEPGTPASEYFKLDTDYCFEIGLTPNRADAASHYGVARDLMAVLKRLDKLPQQAAICLQDVSSFKPDNNDLPVEIIVENTEAAPRYCGVTISGVKVAPSPEWLQKRLRHIGLSPINNIVDATNYVLHELGQPLHAFDAAEVKGNKVIVKTCAENTPFMTLDGNERKLGASDLMICNAEEPMCIAGVFGGIKSGVKENTTEIFLESALFNPVYIRKTAKRFGLSTDASFRFERGVDPNITVHALKRAALLIKEIAGGKISSDITDIYPTPVKNREIKINLNRLNLFTGVAIDEKQIEAILQSLDITVNNKHEKDWTLNVPPYRIDVTGEADIAEEVLRIYGFEHIPVPEKWNSSINIAAKPDLNRLQEEIANILAAKGCHEALNNSLTKTAYNKLIGEEKSAETVEIANQLSADLGVMRQTLLTGLLENIAYNQNRKNSDIALFEFGNTYAKIKNGFKETRRLAIVLSGKANDEHWSVTQRDSTFYTAKGLAEVVLKKINLFPYQISEPENSFLEDGYTMTLQGQNVGILGWINSTVKKTFDIKNDVFVVDFDWDILCALYSQTYNKTKFKELPRFPAARRDLSLLIDQEIRFDQLAEVVKKTGKQLVKEVDLFDVYEGKKLPAGKKSYAVKIILQDENTTLKDDQIDQTILAIQKELVEKFGAELRQ